MGNWLYYLLPIVFIMIVLYIYRPWAKKHYEEDAEIPFEDGDGQPEQDKSSSSP